MNDKTDMNDTTDKPAVFTDTHTHLADPLLTERAAEVIRQADGAGVRRFIVPSANRGDWKAVSDLAADNIIPAFGIHPWWAGGTSERQDLDSLADYLAGHPQAWVGEIGLDYLRASDDAQRQRQRGLLAAQLQLAGDYRRPFVLHNVRSTADLLVLLKQYRNPCGGIVHAFSGSLEEAAAFCKLGLKIGIGSLLLNPQAKKPAAPPPNCLWNTSYWKPTARICRKAARLPIYPA
ncbi:hydrolase, TatD family [Neisseria elongata subsp. glycolytica ATCC 29315]|uniref:Hydrolase, TatD family n=1 Tax=Neisseria elongata subsp. glycolytica ATCC 29315 TaxID=546263 RepID=D4DPQ5_NEIEG|nr:hydrolase, TatD family [Neisseria elongata subsp. glycolytica ATCC 29315]